MATERKGLVTMRGTPLVLQGTELRVGDQAPDFVVRDAQWRKVRLRDFKGKVILISAVPSLDTSVCSLQTKRFNEEAAHLPGDVEVLTVSQDLPFAQSRFCGAEGVQRIRVLSDHVEAKFGKAYGVLIKGMRLLARSVFVVDKDGRVAYVQIVPELTEHPDYEAALTVARQLSSEG